MRNMVPAATPSLDFLFGAMPSLIAMADFPPRFG